LFYFVHFHEAKQLFSDAIGKFDRELLNVFLPRFHFSPAPGRMGYAAAVER
jgi:hypothetical protein